MFKVEGKKYRMSLAGRGIALSAVPIGIMAVFLVSGCQRASDAQASAASSGDSHPKGVSKEDSIKAVEANPHIPPQAKANIIRQLQGGPPKAPATVPSDK